MAKKSDNPKTNEAALSTVEAINMLRADYAAADKAHRKRVRANICEAYELGLRLKKSPRMWDQFRKSDWKGISGGPPDKFQQSEAVRFALKFMVGAGASAQKDASFYYRAIKKFVDEKRTPDELRQLLGEKTLKKLADEYAEENKGAVNEAKPPAESKKTGSESPKKNIDDEGNEPITTKGSPTLATCTLALTGKAQTSLLKTPVGTPITIKGKLLRVESSLEIEVRSLKKREKKTPM